MQKKIVKALFCIIAAGVFLTGCNLFSGADKTGSGTSVETSTETNSELVEEISQFADFDKWFTKEQPGIPQNINVDDYIGDIDTDGLTMKASDLAPSSDVIKAQEEYLCETYAEASTDSSLEAADGSRITVTYKGTCNGEEIDGYSVSSGSYTIGSDLYGIDFDDALVGMHPGESKSFSASYSENDQTLTSDVQGKTVDFEVTLEAIYVNPEFDDDFVKEHTDYKSVEEYEKNYTEDYIENSKSYKVYDLISEAAESMESYPEDFVEAYKQILLGFSEYSYESYLSTSSQSKDDYSFEDFMADSYGDDYEDTIAEQAKSYAATQLAYIKFANSLGITFTQDDYTSWLSDAGISDEYKQQFGYGYVSSVCFQQYVQQELVNKVKTTK